MYDTQIDIIFGDARVNIATKLFNTQKLHYFD
jgi:hypothetical protein